MSRWKTSAYRRIILIKYLIRIRFKKEKRKYSVFKKVKKSDKMNFTFIAWIDKMNLTLDNILTEKYLR